MDFTHSEMIENRANFFNYSHFSCRHFCAKCYDIGVLVFERNAHNYIKTKIL